MQHGPATVTHHPAVVDGFVVQANASRLPRGGTRNAIRHRLPQEQRHPEQHVEDAPEQANPGKAGESVVLGAALRGVTLAALVLRNELQEHPRSTTLGNCEVLDGQRPGRNKDAHPLLGVLTKGARAHVPVDGCGQKEFVAVEVQYRLKTAQKGQVGGGGGGLIAVHQTNVVDRAPPG